MKTYSPKYDLGRASSFLIALVDAGCYLTGSEAQLDEIYPLKLHHLPQEQIDNALNRAFRLAGLTRRDKEILVLRCGLRTNSSGLELNDIATKLGIPERRIERAEQIAVRKLVSKEQVVKGIAQILEELVAQ